MKITCLSRFFCRFQTFRLYREPRNELLMWWLVASAAVVRHITFFCCSCASCAGWVVLWLPRSGWVVLWLPALFSVLFRGCPVVVPRSSQCPSRQTPCFRRQCSHVVASVSAAPPWPPTRECCSEVVPCLVPCGCSAVVRCLWVYG